MLGVAATYLGIAVNERKRTMIDVDPKDIDIRSRIVDAARAEIGLQDPSKYWSGVLSSGPPYPPHWCGGFALWALKQAGIAADVDWQIGKGFCYNLPIVKTPKPGDIAYFSKLQHHAIVESISPDGTTLVTIDGNQQPGESVAVRVRPVASVTAFYSIDPLISQA
jgi:hypothetical protein